MIKILIILLFLSQFANGQVITASAPYRVMGEPRFYYLLTTYSGASAGWSLRKLDSTYTGHAIKVRRSSDNTEQDVDFLTSGYLDTASLKSFVGSNSGYVTTWYDQSGNGRNLTQTTAANQPRIVDAGTVFRVNGKVSIKYIIANSWYLTNTALAISGGANFFMLSVSNTDVVAATNNVIVGMSGSGIVHQHNSSLMYTFAGGISGDASSTVTAQMLNESDYDGSASGNSNRLKLYENGSQLTLSNFTGTVPATVTSTGIDVGRPYGINAAYLGGSVSEVVLWFSNQSANRTGIESIINSYYGIF